MLVNEVEREKREICRVEEEILGKCGDRKRNNEKRNGDVKSIRSEMRGERKLEEEEILEEIRRRRSRE